MPLSVRIPAGRATLTGDLTVPTDARLLVVFAHGSGSSRHSPRNQFVAHSLEHRGLGTLLIDLLTKEEDERDRVTSEFRFEIDLLARRLTAIVDWLGEQPTTAVLKLGLFGASTGAAAALVAAADRPDRIAAIVSRGGRPDLAGAALDRVKAPTLLIVGGDDQPVIELNQAAMTHIKAPAVIEVVPGASHLFEEPGALARVSSLAASWFTQRMPAARRAEWA